MLEPEMDRVKLGKNVKMFGIANLYGCEIGDGSKIAKFVEIQDGVKIGRNCKVQAFAFIPEGVTLEDNVFVGPHACFVNDLNPRAVTPEGKMTGKGDWIMERTLVKKGASIGANATIIGSVTIGENALVGAGAVVTRDVPANSVVVGNPAKVLRKISSKKD